MTQLKEDAYKFDPASSDVEQYEQQLKLLSLQGLLLGKDKLPALLKQFDYILECMQTNSVLLTPQLRARIFEYSLLSKQFTVANDNLAKLTRDYTEALSPIDTRYLEAFFRDSLASDNIDGVAHLVNYANRYDVDVSSYPIQRFRAGLDYYLNKNFNLNKVMTFTKFYQRYYADQIDREAGQFLRESEELTEEERYALSKRVFGKNEDLVDMRSLSEYLVRSLGGRQIIDPLTKEDSLWSLIDFFTSSREVIGVCAQSESN